MDFFKFMRMCLDAGPLKIMIGVKKFLKIALGGHFFDAPNLFLCVQIIARMLFCTCVSVPNTFLFLVLEVVLEPPPYRFYIMLFCFDLFGMVFYFYTFQF